MLDRLISGSLSFRRGSHNKHSRRVHPRFETLEPRMVLSAAPLQAAAFSEVASFEDPLLIAGEEGTTTDSSDSGGQGSIVNGTVVPQSAYPTVGIVNNGCTGTLISPGHVLTAEHCTTSGFGSFRLNNVNYLVADQIVEPTGNDIAILVLLQDIGGVTPSEILRSSPTIGEELTLVGYGQGDTTNNPVFDFGILREGHTDLQFIQSELIGWTFSGDGESSVSFGDSGGPAFVDRGGELVVAGVASFVTGDPWVPGTQGWEVRVDAFEDWIDGILPQAEPPLPLEADLHQELPGAGSTVVSVDGENAWEMGAIQTPSDADSFEFTLDATTDVTLTVAGTDGRLDSELRLFDSGLSEIAQNNDIGGGNTNSQIIQTLDAGTYYFTVSSVSSSIGWFSVAIDLGPNTGNDPWGNPHPLATDITPDADGEIAFRETLETVGDRDVFEFVVDQTSTVQFAATAADSSLNPRLRLFDGGGTEIHDNDDLLSPDETDSYFFETIDPGTYYLMVSSSSSLSSGDYVVTIDGAIGPQTATPGDFNGDGNVDGDDFLIWQASFNVDDGGDADGDGDTDGDDFLVWQGNFGSGSGGGGSKGRPVFPTDGGGNDFFPKGKEKDGHSRGSMIKPSPWHPQRMGYKRFKDGPNLTGLNNKLPKIYLSGQSSHDDRPVSQRDHAKTHDHVFAGRTEWLRPNRGRILS